MLTVLILTGIEKLLNVALKSDPITLRGLEPLAGKSLRLDMTMPRILLDVIFQDDHIRFEPVSSTGGVFEPKGGQAFVDKADCTLKVANPAELLNLLRDSSGNLPIEGDYKVLMQVKQLLAGFDPDIAGQLEPLIGIPLASQLGLVITHLKKNFSHTAKQSFNDVADWANDVAGNGTPDPVMQAEADDLKQQLLKLRADVEREEARLLAIKAEQARLKGD